MYTQIEKGFWSFQQEGGQVKYTCTCTMYMYIQIHYSRSDKK